MAMDRGKGNLARVSLVPASQYHAGSNICRLSTTIRHTLALQGYHWLRILVYAYEWHCKMAGVQNATQWTHEHSPADNGASKPASKRATAELQMDAPSSPAIGTSVAETQHAAAGADVTCVLGTASVQQEGAAKAHESAVPAASEETGGMTSGWPPGSDKDKLRCFWEAYGVVKGGMINEISNMSVVSALLVTLTFGLVVCPEPLQLYSPVLTAFFHAFVALSLVMSLYQLSLGLRTIWLFGNAMTPLYIFKALVHCEHWSAECYCAFKWSIRPLVAAVVTYMLDVMVRVAHTQDTNYVYLPAASVALFALVTGPILFSLRNSFLDRNLHPGYVHVHMQMSSSFLRREIKPLERLYVLMIDVDRAFNSGDAWARGSATNHTFDTLWKELLWAMEHTVTWTDVHPLLGWLDRFPVISVLPQMCGATWWWQRLAIKRGGNSDTKPQLSHASGKHQIY